MFSSMFMGDSKVFDGYLKDISRLFLGVLTLLGMGGGHFVPGSFSYCDCQNFSIATMSSNFLTFPRNI